MLTILVGDWNFVVKDNERFSKTDAAWSGARDKQCAEDWVERLQNPHHLHELQQPHFTCDTATSRSRLDRVYTNHFAADQLDSNYTCAALNWTGLSAHRPIFFARSTPKRSIQAGNSLPQDPLDHPDWPRRVALEYHDLL